MSILKEAITIAGLTDPGMVRSHNEDSIVTDPELGFVVLADGMGGYNAGEVASGMTTTMFNQGLHDALLAQPLTDFVHESSVGRAHELLRAEVARTNAAVLQTSRSQPQCAGMGTTLVSAIFYDDTVTVAHIGDSRLYRLREGHLQPLTRDHSLLQEQLDSGLITEEEARISANRNLVTRALGIDDEVIADVNDFPVLPGDIYLLCSDGLNDMLDDAEIELTLNTLAANLPLAAEHLIQAANDNGGRDNVSVILVRINKSFAVPRGWWKRLCARFCR